MAHEDKHTEDQGAKRDVEIRDLFGIKALDIYGNEPCLVQGAKMGATSFIAGSLFGGINMYWKDYGEVNRRGRFAALQGTIKTIGNYGGLFALVGATFGVTYCALQNSRTKDDPLNTILASCAAGGVIGARVNGTVFGSVLGCGVTAGVAAMGEFFDWSFSPNTARVIALQQQRRERLTTSPAASAEAASDSDAEQ